MDKLISTLKVLLILSITVTLSTMFLGVWGFNNQILLMRLCLTSLITDIVFAAGLMYLTFIND